MKFYEVLRNSPGGRKFFWAQGCRIPEELLQWMNEETLENYRQFQEINKREEGIYLAKGGKSWPDFMATGDNLPHQFVRKEVVDTMLEEGIDGILRITPLQIRKIGGKPADSVPYPEYVVLEAEPGIEMDWKQMGVPHDANNKIIPPYPTPWPPKKWIFNLDSWNGKDLFSCHNRRTPMSLWCSERVKDLADREGWTNVRFDEIEMS